MPRFIPGAIALGARIVPGTYNLIAYIGLFRMTFFGCQRAQEIWGKNQIFRVKFFFFTFFFCVFGVSKAPPKLF